MGPQLTNCCRLEQMDTKEFGKMMKRIQIFEEGRVPSQRGKELENRGRKEKNYKKGVKEAVKQFRNGRRNGAKRPVELGERKHNEGKREIAK